jgi:predicted dehydrogenase
MTKKTFSLIGVGRMGQNHLQVALNLGMEVTAVYDLSQTSLTNVSKILTSPAVLTTSLAEFTDSPIADITTIATTSPGHAELIENLARTGRKVIICEKPLATSASELTQIANLVENFKLRIAVNHQMRFMDQYRLIKKYQSEYQLGKLCTMSVNGANFGLGMNATHYIEAFHWLVGGEISSVTGHVQKQQLPNVRGSNFYDYAGYMLVHGGAGALLFLDFQESVGHQVLVVYNFQFGKIVVNELDGTLTIDSRSISDLGEPTFRYGMPNLHIDAVLKPAELLQPTADLYAEVLANRDFPTHLDGERTVKAALAAILSTKMGGIQVKIDDPALDTMDKLTWP